MEHIYARDKHPVYFKRVVLKLKPLNLCHDKNMFLLLSTNFFEAQDR